HVFLILTSRATPASPVFPYTTLFRSARGGRGDDCGLRHGRKRIVAARVRPRRAAPHRGIARNDRRTSGSATFRSDLRLRRDRRRDRKSTRLNSSHVKISYAVFCLKKT